MTNEELEKIEKRIIELRTICVSCVNNKDYQQLSIHMKELLKFNKKLKKALKESKKNEGKK